VPNLLAQASLDGAFFTDEKGELSYAPAVEVLAGQSILR
jgi:sensor domain CHASE-containing protein